MLTRSLGEVRKIDQERRTVDLVVSSEDVDSYGSIILQSGMDIETRFAKNGVLLWSHAAHSTDRGPEDALAKCIAIRKVGRDEDPSRTPYTVATFEFLKEGVNPRSDMVFEQYRSGVINACSVGLTDVREVWAGSEQSEILALPDEARLQMLSGAARYVIAKSVLFEVSACFVGANPAALAVRELGVALDMAKRLEGLVEKIDALTVSVERLMAKGEQIPEPEHESSPLTLAARRAFESYNNPVKGEKRGGHDGQ